MLSLQNQLRTNMCLLENQQYLGNVKTSLDVDLRSAYRLQSDGFLSGHFCLRLQSIPFLLIFCGRLCRERSLKSLTTSKRTVGAHVFLIMCTIEGENKQLDHHLQAATSTAKYICSVKGIN